MDINELGDAWIKWRKALNYELKVDPFGDESCVHDMPTVPEGYFFLAGDARTTCEKAPLDCTQIRVCEIDKHDTIVFPVINLGCSTPGTPYDTPEECVDENWPTSSMPSYAMLDGNDLEILHSRSTDQFFVDGEDEPYIQEGAFEEERHLYC